MSIMLWFLVSPYTEISCGAALKMCIWMAFCKTGGGLGGFREGACFYLARGWDGTEGGLRDLKLCLVLGFRAACLNVVPGRGKEHWAKGGERVWWEPEGAVGSCSPCGWEWKLWSSCWEVLTASAQEFWLWSCRKMDCFHIFIKELKFTPRRGLFSVVVFICDCWEKVWGARPV